MTPLTIYKPGQGYWTRVLSAVGFAILVLSGVAFIWNQLESVGTLGSRAASTSALVQGLSQWGTTAKDPIASLTAISEVKLDAGQVLIKDNTIKQSFKVPLAQFTKVFDPLIAQTSQSDKTLPLSADDAVGVAVNPRDSSVVVTYQSFATRNRVYIQSVVATVLLLASGIGGFMLMNRVQVVDFFIATEGEMRKVNWPSRRELIGATWLVICGTIFMAVAIFAVDLAFLRFFQWTTVVQTITDAAQ